LKYDPLPKGLEAYSAPFEFPSSWKSLIADFSFSAINYGLLLRWRAALWEMRAFYSVRSHDKVETLSTFGSEIIRMIEQNPDVELLRVPPPSRGKSKAPLSWDELPTIFTFLVYFRDGDGRKSLNYEEARFVYRCINMDISHFLPVHASDREFELSRKQCHIGQPVSLPTKGTERIGALRISAGARLVSGVQFDKGFGPTPPERLSLEIRTAGEILSKVSVIIKYWHHLIRFDLSTPEVIHFKSGFYRF